MGREVNDPVRLTADHFLETMKAAPQFAVMMNKYGTELEMFVQTKDGIVRSFVGPNAIETEFMEIMTFFYRVSAFLLPRKLEPDTDLPRLTPIEFYEQISMADEYTALVRENASCAELLILTHSGRVKEFISVGFYDMQKIEQVMFVTTIEMLNKGKNG